MLFEAYQKRKQGVGAHTLTGVRKAIGAKACGSGKFPKTILEKGMKLFADPLLPA
jgi:hypothetical protein